ncbi:MAG: hypothetical protein OXG15_03330 [Gammaproteobacteria bacterium]|nr:hypothetical protein [Gammaproteobacteria bacterium]
MAQWSVPFKDFVGVNQCSTGPGSDPPDVEFFITTNDGSKLHTWGEITGTYAGSIEAEYLWADSPKSSGLIYSGPDDSIALHTANAVAKKLQKYQDLVHARGLGHLLVVLNSPLTSRTPRQMAEDKTIPLLVRASEYARSPFASVWFGYRLGQTSQDEMEDEKHVFPVVGLRSRFNFFKCIWYDPDQISRFT